jgi:hypothetical protein
MYARKLHILENSPNHQRFKAELLKREEKKATKTLTVCMLCMKKALSALNEGEKALIMKNEIVR